MNAYELISSDLAARLGLKRLTLAVLATSLLCNTFFSRWTFIEKRRCLNRIGSGRNQ